MTFKLFNALNEAFKEHKEVCLRVKDCDCGCWETIRHYNEDTDINEIDVDMRKIPNGELFIFDGDFYEEFEY